MPKKILDEQAILIELEAKKLLSPEIRVDLLKIQEETGRGLLEIIEEKSYLSEEDLVKIKSSAFGFKYIDLTEKKITKEALGALNAEIANNYQVVPFAKEGNILRVALADPNNYKAVEALDFLARKNNLVLEYYFATQSAISAALKKYESLTTEVQDALAGTKKEDDLFLSDEKNQGTEEAYKTAPISKMVSVILRHAVEGAASDVHIEPVGGQTRVRFRLDGILHTSIVLPENVHDAIIARIKVMANLKLDETRIPQDGRFRMTIDEERIDFRVSTLPLVDHEKVTIRILDNKSSQFTLEELGFDGRNLELIKRFIKTAHGMLLVTGPTGSGKTTTLYAVLSMLNNEFVNIVTLEDPIEYYLNGISQSQVNPKAGLTFANGLRSILRQDPDIIMVGEIRDNETAELSIHAALTGHKVLSTLHTNDAWGTITRLVDMDIESFLIASSLKMAIAQRLVRKICPKCKEPVEIDADLKNDIRQALAMIPAKYLPKDLNLDQLHGYHGKGCSHCENSGYHGRIAITEVLEVTEEIENIIANKKYGDLEKVEQAFLAQGMFPMRIDGYLKALKGETSFEEIITATKE